MLLLGEEKLKEKREIVWEGSILIIGNRSNGLAAKEATQQHGKCQVLNLSPLLESLTEDPAFSETKNSQNKRNWGMGHRLWWISF